MNRKPNADLIAIEATGFTVQIRSAKNMMSRAYLAHPAGYRCSVPVPFKSNKRTTAYITEVMRHAQPEEHLGLAIAELRRDVLPFALGEFSRWEADRMAESLHVEFAAAPKKSSRRL